MEDIDSVAEFQYIRTICTIAKIHKNVLHAAFIGLC